MAKRAPKPTTPKAKKEKVYTRTGAGAETWDEANQMRQTLVMKSITPTKAKGLHDLQ